MEQVWRALGLTSPGAIWLLSRLSISEPQAVARGL